MSKLHRCLVAVAGLAVLAGATPANADPVSCQRAIAKAGAKFLQARLKAERKCQDAVVSVGSGSCPDAAATNAISKATSKLSSTIAKACGGDDKVCGGDLSGEDSPASVGWPDRCPDFERDAGCRNPIADCGGIVECLGCVDTAAIDQAIDLTYGDLVLPSADATMKKCQREIGKATAAFLTGKSKAFQKCWDARLRGQHAGTCVPPDPGDGKYLDAIAKAESKRSQAICKACGGPDHVCGGGDDLTPPAIGFPAQCPFVTIPGDVACGGPVADLNGLNACVGCVAEFKADCADRIQLPGLTTYPAECTACPSPPATGPCPSNLQLTQNGEVSDVDLGFTGFAHDAALPTGGRLTLAISGCAGSNQPTCGQCNLNGPVANLGGAAFDTQRCEDDPSISCTTNLDCTNASAAGPCVFFYGPPAPLVAGGVSICLLNQVAGPITGTANLDDGESSLTLPLAVNVHFTGTTEYPCPTCDAGICDDGPRDGLACTSGGTGFFGDVSLDCPPNPGTNAGAFAVTLLRSTADQTRTVSPPNPACRQTGYTSRRCLCDTCNNANAEPCSTDADCPLSGGNPGICGGRRCLAGGNEGAPCAVNSECPGSSCARPGEATQPNICLDDCATPADGSLCVDVGSGQGICPEGPGTNHCSTETFRSCVTDDECNPAIGCPSCLPGQTCESFPVPCFTDNGIVGGSVTASGSSQTPCDGTARTVSGALFCIPPTEASFANTVFGVPGLGRVRTSETVDLY